MVPVFQERIATLGGGQAAWRQEMEQLTRAGSTDAAALQRLCEIGRSFQEQAHSLLVMTVFCREAPGELVRDAEDLVGYFSDAVRQLEAMRMLSQQAT